MWVEPGGRSSQSGFTPLAVLPVGTLSLSEAAGVSLSLGVRAPAVGARVDKRTPALTQLASAWVCQVLEWQPTFLLNHSSFPP